MSIKIDVILYELKKTFIAFIESLTNKKTNLYFVIIA